MNTTDPARLLSYEQAAKLLSISLRHFRRLVDDGKFTIVRVSPRAPRIRASEVLAFISGACERKAVIS